MTAKTDITAIPAEKIIHAFAVGQEIHALTNFGRLFVRKPDATPITSHEGARAEAGGGRWIWHLVHGPSIEQSNG